MATLYDETKIVSLNTKIQYLNLLIQNLHTFIYKLVDRYAKDEEKDKIYKELVEFMINESEE